MRLELFAAVCLSLSLAGCSIGPVAAPSAETGLAIQGTLHGGQQAIVGAHVYLLAAGTNGYGQPSVSLLKSVPGSTVLDTSGGATNGDYYVTTDSAGGFTITNEYSCTPNSQVYLYGLGGNPGSVVNSAAALMAVLGSCPSTGSFAVGIPYVSVNEVTTVAAAYAMAGFATDATHVSSSGTALAQIGIANAFANAGNLVNIATGTALTSTPAGNGAVPQAAINTLANILAACVNSTGTSSTGCTTLLPNALSGGATGTVPSDTATAAINIAHNPAVNVATLYGNATAAPPFGSGLTAAPNDFTLGIAFAGGTLNGPQAIVIDGSGSAWVGNFNDGIVTQLSPAGLPLSGAKGYASAATAYTAHLAVDLTGNVWATGITTSNNYAVTKLSSAGVATPYTSLVANFVAIDSANDPWISAGNVYKLSNSGAVIWNSYDTVGSVIQGLPVAIDGSGNGWIGSSVTYSATVNRVVKLSSAGANLSGANGFTGGGINVPEAAALDRSGNAWFVNLMGGTVTEYSNSGVVLSGTNGFAAGLNIPTSLGIDGVGNVWIGNNNTAGTPNHSMVKLSSSGAVLSGAIGYTAGGQINGPRDLALDPSGNIWVANHAGNNVIEMIGASAPVITPIAAGLPVVPTLDGSSNLGTRP